MIVSIPSPVGPITYKFHGYDYDVKVCYIEGEPYLTATHFEHKVLNRKIYLKLGEALILERELN